MSLYSCKRRDGNAYRNRERSALARFRRTAARRFSSSSSSSFSFAIFFSFWSRRSSFLLVEVRQEVQVQAQAQRGAGMEKKKNVNTVLEVLSLRDGKDSEAARELFQPLLHLRHLSAAPV